MAAQAQTATRKQLDELDALLQKMLGQPAPPSETPIPRTPAIAPTNGQAQEQPNPPPRPPQFPPAAVAYGVPPAVAFAASSPTTASQQEVERRPGWSIDLNPRDGSSVLGGNRVASSGIEALTQPANERPSPTGLLSVQTIPSPVAESFFRPNAVAHSSVCYDVPFLLRPVAWFSNCCDTVFNSFGPVGRMFTSNAGRTLMGYVGLAMLAASVASGALAWIGWSW